MRTQRTARDRFLPAGLGALALALVLLSRGPAAAAGAPPPRPRAEIEAVLSRSPGPPPAERQRPLRIILVANEKDHGPEEHDYPLWQKRWVDLVGGSPGVTVTTAWGWPEKDALAKADVVAAFIGTGGRWNRERIADLDALLARGAGFVAIHSTTITSPEFAKDLADRIGLAWEDGKTTFRHGPVDLEIRALEHPICLGLPTRIHFEDESYWPLVGDAAKADILATADERMPPGTGEFQPQPMMWTVQKGKGRVFSILLGHYTWTFDDPYFRILLLRGMAWAGRESPFRFDPLVLRGARVGDGTETRPAPRKRKPAPPQVPDPKDPRLLLWLDASDRGTLTVDADGAVSAWSSRAAPGKGLSSGGPQRPLYAAGGLGGKPALRFDGKDDVLRDTGFRKSAQDWTLFMALSIGSNAGWFRALFTSNKAGVNDFLSGINLDLGGGPTAAFDVLNLEGLQHEGQCSLKEEPGELGGHVISVARGAGRARASIDGIPEGERTSRDVPASLEEIRLGARCFRNPAGTLPLEEAGFLDGAIAEVLLFGADLPEAERAGIESYLLGKYGAAVVEAREPTLEEAFAALSAYDPAKGRRALGPIDAALNSAHGSPEATKALEDRLLAALAAASTADAKDFICRRLGLIGSSRSVPALAALLGEERLSHQARIALERISGPEAAAAIRAAIGKVRGKPRAGLVDSLGRLGGPEDGPLLQGLLGNGDADTAGAAAAALGRLGLAAPPPATNHKKD